jgi:protein-S-isoprenylcysteine O-methyltransferase Ste14
MLPGPRGRTVDGSKKSGRPSWCGRRRTLANIKIFREAGMTELRVLDLCLLVLWWTVDNIIVFGRRAGEARRADRGSLTGIVLMSWVGVGLSLSLAFAGIGLAGRFTAAMQASGLAIFAGGIALRFTAIAQLGAHHMPVVAIRAGHRLVDAGLYRGIRHPSYLGACIGYLGFGLGLGSWVGALALLAAVLPGYLYRIHVEERALLESLGEEYAAYRKRTRRLLPGVY